MAWSGRQKHRDRDPSRRFDDEPLPGTARAFRITDAQRQAIAQSLRHIDEARVALESRQDAKNRPVIRELLASADRIFDIINGLEDVE